MPPTPFHPDDGLSKQTGRLGRLTKREAASLASLKVLARKQGLSLGKFWGTCDCSVTLPFANSPSVPWRTLPDFEQSQPHIVLLTLTLGLVRGPGEQSDVCLLRFLRAQGFEEKRVRAWPCMYSCKGSRRGWGPV